MPISHSISQNFCGKNGQREIIAYFSTPIDDPKDFLDQFRLGIRADEVDENGNSPPYVIIFDVDQDGVKEDGTSGNVRIMEILNENGTCENTVNRLDFDETATATASWAGSFLNNK